MPIMSNITLFFTSVENTKIMPVTAIAPANAAHKTAMNPVKLTEETVILPPISNMTRATPKPAPPLIPKMEGPANGFLNAVCNISPLTERAAPVSIAVMDCGNLDSSTM